jgi:hypothetical protein
MQKLHVGFLRTFQVLPVKLKNGSVVCHWCTHSLSLSLIERLVISKKHVQARNEEWNDSDLLKMAWADLMLSYPADSFVADVDLECLAALEARMFEDSEEAEVLRNESSHWL